MEDYELMMDWLEPTREEILNSRNFIRELEKQIIPFIDQGIPVPHMKKLLAKETANFAFLLRLKRIYFRNEPTDGEPS
jgi:hypothetical protein